MNNLILQKLIHAYQLIDPSNKGKEYDFKFITNFTIPNHAYKLALKYRKTNNDLEHMKDELYKNGIPKKAPRWSFLHGSEDKDYITEEDFGHTPETIKFLFKELSKMISNSQKFYMDYETDNASWLTAEEIQKCSSEVSVYCPYPLTLLQVNKETQVINIIAEEIEVEGDVVKDESFMDKLFSRFQDKTIDSTIIRFRVAVYNKIKKHTVFDFNCYDIEFYRENDYRFNKQNLDSEMGWNTVTSILDGYRTEKISGLTSNEVYEEKEIQNDVNQLMVFIVNQWLQFITFLTYPQIRDIKEKSGRPNIWINAPIKKHSDSIYKDKPRFEHKELVIRMYETEGKGHGGVGSGEGKALHSVRKHLRTLQSGKKTWVKAHFRGNRSLGVIEKDYSLK